MSNNPTQAGSRFLSLVLAGLFVAAFAGPALATWSIAVVNYETGEVAVASATCLANFNLKKNAGVVVVGKGAGQAQSMVDTDGVNRTTMANSLQAGMTAQMIIDELIATDPQLNQHQYGVAVLGGGAGTYTGISTAQYTNGLTGNVGPIHYAIQGNVLTGEGVLMAAESALVSTPGDLSQKIMAAMQAAKVFGGDGRCSCGLSPTACGCPPTYPPHVFPLPKKEKRKKSAHVSYMVIARIGDVDGVFQLPEGFANGSYYNDIVITTTTPVDTVDMLQTAYNAWRVSWAGHADHLNTEKVVIPRTIEADGGSKAELLIALADIDNQSVPEVLGREITITHADESAGATLIGPVENLGHGTYSVTLAADSATGIDVFRIVVEDGKGPVTLYPFPRLNVVAPPKAKRLH
ncbi:MAG: DUF1028 domain-containing protein [Planctomycetota bacterium]